MANKSKKSQSQKTTKKIPKNEELTKPSTTERVPADATNPATDTPLSPPEIESGAKTEVETTEPTTAPELPPADGTPAVEPAQKEKTEKKSIPKVNKPVVPKKTMTKVDMSDDVAEAQELVDNSHRQLTPQQAYAWAMTQNDPVAAVKRLIRERRLNSPTDTLKLLQDNGHQV